MSDFVPVDRDAGLADPRPVVRIKPDGLAAGEPAGRRPQRAPAVRETRRGVIPHVDRHILEPDARHSVAAAERDPTASRFDADAGVADRDGAPPRVEARVVGDFRRITVRARATAPDKRPAGRGVARY